MDLIILGLPDQGNFLVTIIRWLVTISGSVAVGIILFTVALKLITFPFDYISRAAMRKNSLKMEAMRPELEKLQKQYANNKDLYNQKMMALYKKNGYSMFGACLPTIITLVIFIVAINAFTSYGRWQNSQYFYEMASSYNQVIYEGMEVDNDLVKIENRRFVIDNEKIYLLSEGQDSKQIKNTVNEKEYTYDFNKYHEVKINAENKEIVSVRNYFTLSSQGGYIYYQKDFIFNKELTAENYLTNVNEVVEITLKTAVEDKTVYLGTITGYESNQLTVKISDVKNLIVDQSNIEKVLVYPDFNYDKAEITAEFKDTQEVIMPLESGLKNSELKNDKGQSFTESEMTAKDFIIDICQTKAAETFKNENAKFLWVKNIWVQDSPLKHPVIENVEDFEKEQKYTIGSANYSQLTAKLGEQKSVPNGYFILCILTAGISFLTQFITNKSQKGMDDFQTVDGQSKQTKKVMMFMMPAMMAVFSFIYTAAFSLYIIISSGLGILTTLLINWITTKKYQKDTFKVKGLSEKEGEVIRGRIYVEKEEPKEKKKKEKKVKKVKVEEPTKGDFLTGPVKKKK